MGSLTDYTVKYLGTNVERLPADDLDVWTFIPSESPEEAITFVNADSDCVPGDACYNEADFEIWRANEVDVYVLSDGTMTREIPV